ncbi:hypothetical protein LINPERHAP2_LOCUS45188 [Linum perenne]
MNMKINIMAEEKGSSFEIEAAIVDSSGESSDCRVFRLLGSSVKKRSENKVAVAESVPIGFGFVLFVFGDVLMLCGGRESDGTKASLLQDHVPPVTMRRSTVNGITNAPEMATSIQCHNCINPHPTRLPLHRLPVTFRHPIGEFRPRMRRNRFSEWQPVKIGVQFEHIADQLSDLLQATPNELLDMPVRALEPFQARVLVAQGGA